MKDPKAITSLLTTLALAACAVLLILQNDVVHALIFAALLVPNHAQLLHTLESSALAPVAMLGTIEAQPIAPPTPAPPPAARGFALVRTLFGLSCLALVACGWWAGGGRTAVVNAEGCIESEALKGRDIAAIGQACLVPIAKVLETLLTSPKPDVATTPASHEAWDARRRMLAVDGGY